MKTKEKNDDGFLKSDAFGSIIAPSLLRDIACHMLCEREMNLNTLMCLNVLSSKDGPSNRRTDIL